MGYNPITAVAVCGCHLQADMDGKGWEEIVFGRKPDDGLPTLEGRATMGIITAFRYNAKYLLFGTGASHTEEGISEAMRTTEILTQLVSERRSGLPFAGMYHLHDDGYEFLQRIVTDGIVLDEESTNTRQEMSRAIHWCLGKVERLIVVSSPWHARAYTDALEVAHQLRTSGAQVPEIFAVSSHGSTEGVVISEPPHRGDRPRVPIHNLIREVNRYGRGEYALRFYDAFNTFLWGWKRAYPEK